MYTIKKKPYICKPFSLIELVAAMVLFIFLMIIIVTMFNSTQETFSTSVDRDNIYSNVSMVFNLMTRDLQSSLYEDDKIGFWQQSENELNFIAVADSSKICEIRYKYKPDNPTDNTYTIQRSEVDSDKHAWNFYNKQLSSAGTMNSGVFRDLMGNVTELKFTCFDKGNNIILPSESNDTAYPYSVKIDISCLSEKGALLYKETNDNEIKRLNERKFTKTVYLGERY